MTKNSRDGCLNDPKVVRIQGATIYIAEVDLPGGRDMNLHFTEDGILVKSTEEISRSELPDAAKRAVESVVAENGKLDNIEKVVSGGVQIFKLEIERPGSDLHVTVSADGRILEQIEELED
jgi:hypothetical protein